MSKYNIIGNYLSLGDGRNLSFTLIPDFGLIDVRTTKAEEGLPTSDFQLPISDFLFPTSDLTPLSGSIAAGSAIRVLMLEGKAQEKERLYRSSHKRDQLKLLL